MSTRTPTTTIASQFFHDANEPLDKSSQVQSFSDLNTTAPYKGRLVHVIDEGKIYVCAGFDAQGAIWRPLFSDDGTTLFLTTRGGELFKITVVHDAGDDKGRINVEFPDA